MVFSKTSVFSDLKLRLRVDGRPKCREKTVFSKISTYVWTGPEAALEALQFRLQLVWCDFRDEECIYHKINWCFFGLNQHSDVIEHHVQSISERQEGRITCTCTWWLLSCWSVHTNWFSSVLHVCNHAMYTRQTHMNNNVICIWILRWVSDKLSLLALIQLIRYFWAQQWESSSFLHWNFHHISSSRLVLFGYLMVSVTLMFLKLI